MLRMNFPDRRKQRKSEAEARNLKTAPSARKSYRRAQLKTQEAK